jgi:hypothetical protein
VFKNGSRLREEADFGAKKHYRLVVSAAAAVAAMLERTLEEAERRTGPGKAACISSNLEY